MACASSRHASRPRWETAQDTRQILAPQDASRALDARQVLAAQDLSGTLIETPQEPQMRVKISRLGYCSRSCSTRNSNPHVRSLFDPRRLGPLRPCTRVPSRRTRFEPHWSPTPALPGMALLLARCAEVFPTCFCCPVLDDFTGINRETSADVEPVPPG